VTPTSAATTREETVLRFVERFALVLSETGLPRMPARVFAYVLAHDALGMDRGELVRIAATGVEAAFCPPEFTVAALRAVYEAVWGVGLDPRNFHRKVTSTPGFVAPTGRTTMGEPGRPARLFKAGSATVLYTPMLRRG
jgi:8-oxo-dGTP diphosphatase